MLGAIAGAEAAGVYRVATRGADVVVSVLAALNLALAPTFAQLYATGDMRRLERLASIGTRLGLIASLPVVVSFGVFGSWILGTIFGSDFARGSTALAILGAGQLANAAAGPVGLLLNMTGHERDAAPRDPEPGLPAGRVGTAVWPPRAGARVLGDRETLPASRRAPEGHHPAMIGGRHPAMARYGGGLRPGPGVIYPGATR